MREKFYRYCLLIHILAWAPFVGQHFWEINAGILATLVLGRMMHIRGCALPSWAGGAIIVSALFLLYNKYGTLKGLEVGVGLLAFLGALKTAEIVKKRDFLAQLLISELLLTGHLLSSDSLITVLYILAVNFLIFWTLMAFYGNDERDRWSPKTLRIHSKLFGLALILSVGFFFIFPRIPVAKFFARMDVPISRMGFSDEIKPGDFTRIARDDTPVFRAAFISGQAPSYQEMYWRGATLSKVEGMAWKREKQGLVTEWTEISTKQEYVYEVDFSTLREDFLFALPRTTKYERLSPGRILNKGGGTYRFYPRLQKKIRYRGSVTSARHRDMAPKERQRYLSLPPKISPKVSAYVEEIRAQAFTPEERVKAVMDRFGMGFTYTLSPGVLSGDYLEDFLFRSKQGYCEHFASATGILLRMMDIPARVVVGFHGGLWNPLGEYYILRNQDAHAWVEFWREEGGWQRIDPVEYVFPERISQGVDVLKRGLASQSGEGVRKVFMTRWRTIWFAVDMAYYRLARSFFALDLEAQKKTLARLGLVGKVPLKMFLLLGGIFALCGLIFFFLVVRSGSKLGQLERYYSLLCRKLAALGIDKKATQGPKDYCQGFNDKVKNFEEIQSVFEDYILIKYAGEVERTPSFVEKVKSLKVEPILGC